MVKEGHRVELEWFVECSSLYPKDQCLWEKCSGPQVVENSCSSFSLEYGMQQTVGSM
jgi:hypothetical protein